MESYVLSALNHLHVSELSRADWIAVGMALKAEGLPCSVWDEWSRPDKRYHPGECQRKWESFRGSSKPVTGGTIVQLARERGWVPFEENRAMDWDDYIEYDGDEVPAPVPTVAMQGWNPSGDLITYLETLFHPDDKVAYVTNDVWMNDEGKWVPSKGAYDRTAAQLISEIKKHPDDLGAVLGDWKPDVGAWIRFNPVDGNGVRNENVTRFQYALVESDVLSVDEQYAAYQKLELPIATLVHSGGKSLHAIVRVDASNETEYRERVDYLYRFLNDHGVQVDTQNKNPARLSRMPGVTRNGNSQYLVATNIGRKSWTDWLDYAEDESDNLGEFEYPGDMINDRPPLAPELIHGLLRIGHKMIVSGASKSAKSFFLMELGISISEGRNFLGFPCSRGNVLYINLEIDRASCLNRVFSIYDAYGIKAPRKGGFCVWNLRGLAMPLDKLVPKIIRRVKRTNINAIIIDPIYKVITGEENSATDMGYFCNQFDLICNQTGCSVIYAHHHSKGAQAGKAAQDRSSGSGVFARDPDAIIDLVELELTDEIMNMAADSPTDTAWQMEMVARDFPEPAKRKIWFKYPLHVLDETGDLKFAFGRGDPRRNLKQNKEMTAKTQEDKDELLRMAFDVVSMGRAEVPIKEMAEFLADDKDKVNSKRVELYRWLKSSTMFSVKDGLVRESPPEMDNTRGRNV